MDIFSLLLIFITVELFESNWQKSDSMYGLISNNFTMYKKSIFLYFTLHLSFFYTIFVSIYLSNFSFWMSSILVIKFLDIAFKLNMMQKLSNGSSLEEVMPINVKMTPIFRYMNVLIYPLSFVFAVGLI
ncbi:MAG: hypothetical protein CL624_12350 [Arcobacter sp.]|uniref:Uncharacterized protein n=3 Tax=Poseidonibacter ostreae TaxID=2654171 RepID=A0A6L4WT42_9BACT|nr:hypothetical protein GA417_05935 [Poseidonibacter ostreae]KAB7888931.1 hypothetical protein GBG19_07640 [Poseidonibacter ostreae]KAB7889364.1 hypothetical protein GBG18_11055 [Poseidonibacter ostreae]MAC84913.1 hypothetical protein [Arcobacter sp.]